MDTPSPYESKERHPVHFSARHMVLRSYPSQPEMQGAHQQMERGWTHIRPNSVLVASMGNHWKQGSWNRVIDMVDHTQEKGVYCALSEIQDRCFNPYDALGTMRNEAILTALTEGFQFLCYVDNDVKPEKDTLLRLLQWQLPIIAPYVAEPGTGNKLFGPGTIQPNTGVQRAKWCVLSMVLFNTAVFQATGPDFWRDAIGADEGYHFTKLFFYGYSVYLDTGIQLEVGGRPLYPLALNRVGSGGLADMQQAAQGLTTKLSGILGRRGVALTDPDRAELTAALDEYMRLSKGDRDILLQQRIERFVQPPDRRPIDPASPWIKDGEYAPFLVKMDQAQKQGAPPGAISSTELTAAGASTSTILATGMSPDGLAKSLAFSQVGNG